MTPGRIRSEPCREGLQGKEDRQQDEDGSTEDLRQGFGERAYLAEVVHTGPVMMAVLRMIVAGRLLLDYRSAFTREMNGIVMRQQQLQGEHPYDHKGRDMFSETIHCPLI